MFTNKPKPLPSILSENYYFVVSSDQILSNIKKIYLITFSNILEVSKHPEKYV